MKYLTVLVLGCLSAGCTGSTQSGTFERDFTEALTGAKWGSRMCFDITKPENLMGRYCLEKEK